MKFIVRLLIFVFLLFLFAQFILPGAASRILEKTLQPLLDEPSKLRVKIASFPAAEIMLGKVDNINVYVEDFSHGDLDIDRAEFNLKHINFDLKSLFSGDFQYKWQEGAVRFEITEPNINAYFSSLALPGIKDASIELENNLLIFSGQIEILGNNVPAKVSGNLQPAEGKIYFQPQKIDLGGYDLGAVFEERLKEMVKINLDISSLPCTITETDIKEGILILYGKMYPENIWNI